ncbi:Uncharacterised protein [Mycobacteroides abscessus]|nr:Uncharacterised protein [Mycobacteroides abscessus]
MHRLRLPVDDEMPPVHPADVLADDGSTGALLLADLG